MKPSKAIAMLDRQIKAHGQTITFRHNGTSFETRGAVRGYRPEQLVGLITQKDRNVIVSPTALGDYTPAAQDDFQTAGQVGKVTAAEPIHLNGVIVRWNLTVRLN